MTWRLSTANTLGLLRCGAIVLILSLHQGVAIAAALEAGQPAPEFELQGSDGNPYTLSTVLATSKRGLVLAWFPKAFTPG